jgi:hypothetical protein
VWGEESPYEPESLGGGIKEEDEDKEEGEVTPPPHSLPPEDLPSLGDLFSQQAGIFIGVTDQNYPGWVPRHHPTHRSHAGTF